MKRKYNPSARFVSEDVIENYLVEQIENIGGMCVKGNPRNQRGFVDRVCILPQGLTIYVECKRPNRKPRPNQRLMINRFIILGHHAVYVSNKGMVDVLIVWITRQLATTRVVGTDHICYRPTDDCERRVDIPWKHHLSRMK